MSFKAQMILAAVLVVATWGALVGVMLEVVPFRAFAGIVSASLLTCLGMQVLAALGFLRDP